MDVDDVVWVEMLWRYRFSISSVFEDVGIGDGGFEGLRIYAAGGVIDEDDTFEGGHSFGGAGLGMRIGDEGLEEWDVGAGRFAGLVGLSADNEVGSFKMI